jgi:hypothetical protein
MHPDLFMHRIYHIFKEITAQNYPISGSFEKYPQSSAGGDGFDVTGRQ